MRKSAFISDLFFAFFSSFLFSVCLFRYWGLSLFLALFIGIVCGSLIAASIAAILLSKRKNFYLRKSDEQKKEKLLLHLALLSEDKVNELFQSLLLGESPLKKTGKLRLSDNEHVYFLSFRLTPVNADDIAKYARMKTSKEKILLCSGIEEKAKVLCERWNIAVQTEEEVYLLFKKQNKLPQHFLGEKLQKGKPTRKLQLWFAKKNGKSFLVCGSMLLLISFLTPFPYYYLLFGGSMLLTSAFIRIFGHE